MKKIIFALLAIFTLTYTHAETGANVDFTYTVDNGTIHLTDNSVITDTAATSVWDVYFQVDTGNYPQNVVRMMAYHTNTKVDTTFSFAYPKSGKYHVSLIYQKWNLGNPGSNGGNITTAKDIIVIVCQPQIIPLANDTFQNGTVLPDAQLMTELNVLPHFIWKTPDFSYLNQSTTGGYFKPTTLNVGDTVELWEFIVRLGQNDSILFNNECVAVAKYVKVDTTTTGIFSLLNETANVKITNYRKEVTIQSDSEIKRMQVYNIAGQLVYETQVNNTRQTFSLPQLTDGVYIVTAQSTDNKAVSQKLILQ